MRFRSEILWVPITIVCLAILTKRLRFAVRPGELLGVHGNDSAVSYLITLGLCVVAALLAIKQTRGR